MSGKIIRGIRDFIESGHIIGRTDSGRGPPHLISIQDLAAQLKTQQGGNLGGGGGGVTFANPTATAGETAVNGSANTAMRSDAAPAVQVATNLLKGILKPDNVTITISAGVISAVHNGDVTGPGSSTDGDFAQFNGTTGKIIKDGGLSLDTSTSLGTSDSKIPSQKAVKTYADTKQAGDADLTAIAALSTTGILVRTAADTWALRTLQQPAAGITITNPAGVSGDPTLALANDLSALEAMSGTGFVSRTASETYAQRTLQAGSGISISNADGVSGDPTITALGSGGGTGTTVAFFCPTEQSAGSSTQSDCAWGEVYVPKLAISVIRGVARFTTVNSATYKMGIAAFDPPSHKMTGAATYSSVVTIGSSAGAANTQVDFQFASPVALSVGTKYLIFVVRTDGAANVSQTFNTANTANRQAYGVEDNGVSMAHVIANLNPGTSDTWTVVGTGAWWFAFAYIV